MMLVLRRRSIITAFILTLVLALSLVTLGATQASAVWNGVSQRRVPVYSVATENKVVALSFDAAWGADKTVKIMDILDEYSADATFFLVGFWIESFPQETKLIADRGFEIGNHSDNHLNMSKLSGEEIRKELEVVNNQIVELTGRKPTYFRPPFGDYDDELIEEVEALDMVPVQWSVDSLDWKGLSGAQIAERVLSRVDNGSIILFHNNSDHVLDALPLVLIGLENRGYTAVGMSDLVATENYEVDHAGVQHVK